MGKAGAFLLSAVLAILLSFAATAAVDSSGDVDSPPTPPGLEDQDANGLSDSLEAILDAGSPRDMVEVIVTVGDPGYTAAMAQQAVGRFQVTREFLIINGFAATMTGQQARNLAQGSAIHRIEEDFQVSATIDGANADFGSDDARIDFAVDGSGLALGRPVGICIVDTGIFTGHEQLDNGKVAGWFDAINGLPNPYDDQGHGTHVASISAGDGVGGPDAAKYRGVANGAALFGAKTLNGQGSGTATQVISGVEWCASQPGVDIISMSLGTAQASDGRDSMSEAVNCAADPNWSNVCGNTGNSPKIAVVAAGNAGSAQQTVGSPAAAEKAITIGALANQSGDGRGVYLAAFSSRGPTLDGRVKPDIAAPGVRIQAASNIFPTSYVTKSGTSMAAPFTSGIVGLILDANPDLRLSDPVTGQLPVDRVRDLLAATAQDRGPDGPGGGAQDNEYGFGVVDVYAAVAESAGMAPGSYQATVFPQYMRVQGSVSAGGEWLSDPFDVPADGNRVAAVLTIEGIRICTLRGNPNWCGILGGWAWDPDLDMELVDAATGVLVPAAGGDITRSECPLAGEWCGASRQETVYYLPPGPGTYRVRVYSFDNAGDFALEISGFDSGLVADAGADQGTTDNDASGAETVVLDGSASQHKSGIIASYEWTEDSVPIASGATPAVDLALGNYTIVLTVTDTEGNTDSDTVLVNVAPNSIPVADAGPDQEVVDGDADGSALVTLDAGGSFDSGGGLITSYQWSSGGAAIGSGQTVTLPLPVGVHDIGLTVTDNGGAIAQDTVTVTVIANQAPVADAGADQTIVDNDGTGAETAVLDGSGSTDPGGTIVSYEWSQGGVSVGTGAVLSLPLPIGVHTFTLTVTDAAGLPAADSVTVTVLANQTPFADAGADFTVTDFDGRGDETFTLDGGGSSDPGGAIVSYEWTEAGVVVGGSATVTVTREVGIYSFTLTVADAAGVTASDEIVVTVKPDPNANKVVLMTHFDGPDGATTAVDESDSGHPLTFLDDAQLDTAESRFGGASALFGDAVTSLVSVPDSDDWHFGAGEFTAEAWVQFSSLASYSAFLAQFNSADNQISWLVDWGSDKLRFLYSPDGTDASRVTLQADWTPVAGTWYHVAVDRDSNDNLRVYVDGRVLINHMVTAAFHDSTDNLRIGVLHAGWMDEVRITKGVARYQGAFAIPNRPATFDDVVLLARLDGPDGATTAVDESDSGHPLTFLDDAQLDTAESRFGGASALFGDAVTSLVSVPDSDDWHFGAGEFTAEAWVQFSSLASYSAFLAQFNSADNQISWLVDWGSDKLRFLYSPDGTDASRVTLQADWTPVAGTWYHVAVDRDSNDNLRVYVDGRVLINHVVTAAFHDSTDNLRIGVLHAGWMDEIRITKGAAQYAGSFTPPTKTPEFNDVKLLAHLDGPDGATNAIDESNSGHPLTFLGDAQLDTAESRFGGASVLFGDAVTSVVSLPDSDDWHFGADEFTAEAWVRFSSITSYSAFFAQFNSADNQISWLVDWGSDKLRFLYSPDGTDASRVTLQADWTPVAGTWYHVAVDRDAGKRLRIYVNGEVLLEADAGTWFHDSTDNLRIGVLHAGWMDEVRITKGLAQYGGSFIPPGEPFAGAVATASAN